MKRVVQVSGLGVLMVALSGCTTTGLSTRETRGQNYSTFLYALYDGQEAVDSAVRPALQGVVKLPAKIAVAQIGEVAPPQRMVEALQREVGLFRMVQGIPGVFELERTDRWYGQSSEPSAEARARAQTQVTQMLRVAKDLGMDALFLYGGSIDYGTRQTELSVLDLTIVGSYLVPSQELKGTARSSGALVELASGRVVFVVSAEASAKEYAATFNVEGAHDHLLDTLREATITKLTRRFIERMQVL